MGRSNILFKPGRLEESGDLGRKKKSGGRRDNPYSSGTKRQ